MLLGAKMPIKFWPYAFHHYVRIKNSIPSRDQVKSPLEMASQRVDDFSKFHTFGCRVWVRPSGQLALGHFTRRKLKSLPTWPKWQAGEHKQLDHFAKLGMYGAPIPRPEGATVLRQHWQYRIKRDGTRRSRNCCDGSARTAPGLHGIASTYSSCVDQPVQRLFFALTAALTYKAYGGDAQDAYAHSADQPSNGALPIQNRRTLSHYLQIHIHAWNRINLCLLFRALLVCLNLHAMWMLPMPMICAIDVPPLATHSR